MYGSSAAHSHTGGSSGGAVIHRGTSPLWNFINHRPNVAYALGSLFILMFVFSHLHIPSEDDLDSLSGKQHLPPPWRSPETLSARTVYQSKFARVEVHKVAPASPGGKVRDDWVWVDIQDQVNILVHERATGKFVLFRQRKYGLQNESLAVVGGLIESGETPEEAARRELWEEMGLIAGKLHFLGKFRTDVNRGGGYCSCFIATDSYRPASELDLADSQFGDEEAQIKVRLTTKELLQAVSSNQFGEVKWTATVALALLSGVV